MPSELAMVMLSLLPVCFFKDETRILYGVLSGQICTFLHCIVRSISGVALAAQLSILLLLILEAQKFTRQFGVGIRNPVTFRKQT
jgi:hypothetical protein